MHSPSEIWMGWAAVLSESGCRGACICLQIQIRCNACDGSASNCLQLLLLWCIPGRGPSLQFLLVCPLRSSCATKLSQHGTGMTAIHALAAVPAARAAVAAAPAHAAAPTPAPTRAAAPGATRPQSVSHPGIAIPDDLYHCLPMIDDRAGIQ